MAIIQKIRDKAGIAVGVVGVGLGLFVVGGDLLGPNSAILSDNTRVVGSVAGNDVPVEEFDAELQRVKSIYYLNTNRQAGEQELPMLRRQAWNQIVFNRAYREQFEQLGIQISQDELIDMIQGNNIHQAIKAMFGNPQTGEFDVNNVIGFLQQIDQVDSRYQAIFKSIEDNLPSERLRSKYEYLLKETYYPSALEAELRYKEENSSADVKYVYVPYSSVPDSAVNVTDAGLKEFYNKNKKRYEISANRELKYVIIPIQPTAADDAKTAEEARDLMVPFSTTENDTAFVEANSDLATSNFLESAPGNLPLGVDASAAVPGKVFGPIREGESYKLYKIVDEVEDSIYSVRASHILIKPEGDDKAAARQKAQGILNDIKNGADFAEMARTHGTDGTKSKGGDLGWFTEGQMVPTFNDAVFENPVGLIPRLVETNFGFHIIEVTAEKTNKKFNVASVQLDVLPSDETVSNAYRRAGKFAQAGSGDDLIAQVEADSSLNITEDMLINTNDRQLNGIYNDSKVREIIRWAYTDAEVGSVSKVFELDNMFVLATLVGQNEKGDDSDISVVSERVRPDYVKDLKKEVILSKISGLTGSVDEIAQAYGAQAQVYTQSALKMNATSITGVGVAPVTVGAAFSMKAGETSKPVADENGVTIVSVSNISEAGESADYTVQKSAIQTQKVSNVANDANVAINEYADVKDEIYKFY